MDLVDIGPRLERKVLLSLAFKYTSHVMGHEMSNINKGEAFTNWTELGINKPNARV